ncbi:TraR/DksA C4-type zinc finger protein [Roseateles flavus]|uniref:TraR/DksA C4-type zinc finger protein n=1 Tax=Roseateles flavus TaxID=3149041 RepID=A0ABV0GG24_9BURK
MTDIYDRAQALEARQREEALARFSAMQPAAGAQSLSHCVDCGEDIPLARQRAVRGCKRCVTCQQLAEHVQAR